MRLEFGESRMQPWMITPAQPLVTARESELVAQQRLAFRAAAVDDEDPARAGLSTASLTRELSSKQ
jgi:hypothetical protein